MAVPIIAALAKSGLTLLANAFLAKGRQWVEEKVGAKLPADNVTELAPEALASLKQAEMEHEEELARIRFEENKLGHELEAKYLEDRQSARLRDTAYVQAGRKNERGDHLAYLAVGGLLAVVLLVFLAEIQQGQKEILLFVLGILSKIVADVYAFEFGSSKSEQRKDNAMTKWLDESE